VNLTSSLGGDHKVSDYRNSVAASIEIIEKVAAKTELGARETNGRNELWIGEGCESESSGKQTKKVYR